MTRRSKNVPKEIGRLFKKRGNGFRQPTRLGFRDGDLSVLAFLFSFFYVSGCEVLVVSWVYGSAGTIGRVVHMRVILFFEGLEGYVRGYLPYRCSGGRDHGLSYHLEEAQRGVLGGAELYPFLALVIRGRTWTACAVNLVLREDSEGCKGGPVTRRH